MLLNLAEVTKASPVSLFQKTKKARKKETLAKDKVKKKA
jgi:hypothetical protein